MSKKPLAKHNEIKGIVLAGGSGTRLHPITLAVSKQLLPVYDKPMIFYPISVLMMSGIREILLISTPVDLPLYQRLLGDGKRLGISIEFAVQERPAGLAEAFIIGRKFLNGGPACLVLGDNIFFGHGLRAILRSAAESASSGGATIFGYWVKDPERYGVVEFDATSKAIGIQEKPTQPRSSYAVPGLYYYDHTVSERAALIQPSARGELEITDLNNAYLNDGALRVELLGRGFAWLDTGTHEALLQASNFVQSMEERQGLKIGCLEEVAFEMGFIDSEALCGLAEKYNKSDYREYLLRLAREAKDPLLARLRD